MSKLHILKVVKPLQNFNLTLKNTRGPESKDSGDIFFLVSSSFNSFDLTTSKQVKEIFAFNKKSQM